jgi:hypothetical protein
MDQLQAVFEREFNAKLQTLIDQALDTIDITELVEHTVQERFESGAFQQYISDTIKQHVNGINISDTAIARLEQKGQAVLQQHMPRVVQLVQDRIDTVLGQTVDQKLENFSFPERSIDPKLIDTTKLKLTRDNIVDFGTTDGIEDLATSVQLTILDGTVVIEHTLISRTIQTDTLIAKDIARDQPWLIDLKKEILDAVPVPETPKDWSWEIAQVDAKIDVATKRQGQLKELEVVGEASLSDVLYTTPGNRRVGINTMEPSDALTVWDNETEVVIGKHKAQEGYIGTRRRQDLNIGANNKVGITVRSDGSVIVDKLVLNERAISTSDTIPGTAAKRGDIVLNTKPEVGKYLGWVCIDGIRWASFGKIE